ncbi:phosphoglycerate kinase [Candidatus Micrarchaeota archaeon]|nr:phosphoglycerate kinase [Candidatus Micrarchaeota archaeon]
MTQKEFLTMDDFQPEGKTVLLRVDINSAIENGKIQDSQRMAAHAQTIAELSGKNAKVVVLAHQGRPDKKDFLRLDQHAKLLQKHVKRQVRHVHDVSGKETLKRIRKMANGKIVLLENVRMLSEEELDSKKKAFKDMLFVQELSSVCDVFVNDAFSVAHRAQASNIGFAETLPSYAGRVMQREYEAIQKATRHAAKPRIHLLGGGKPDEPLALMEYALQNGKADRILTSGVLGELCLLAKGRKLGPKEKWLDQEGYLAYLPRVAKLVEQFGDAIDVPGDFAYADADGIRVEVKLEELPSTEKPVFDIGSNTASAYAREIRTAQTVYLKGPVGKYEEKAFELGTRRMLEAMTECKGFTLLGGGHTITAIEKFGFPFKKFSHVSLAGGALLEMLQGKPLPALEALKASARQVAYAQKSG